MSFQRLPSAIPSTFENDGVVVLMICITDINRLDIKLEIISSYTGSLFFFGHQECQETSEEF